MTEVLFLHFTTHSLFCLFWLGTAPLYAGQADQIARIGAPSPYLLTAPHDGFDLHTGEIVERTCAGLFPRWGCVVATGYRKRQTPINVNRPTEGIDVAHHQEAHTQRAQDIYAQYLRAVESLSLRPDWYVEIHGNARPKSSFHMEIACSNVTEETAQKIKTSWTRLLQIHGLSEFTLLIEPLDEIYFGAESTKIHGSLDRFKPALHIELPKALRFEKREQVIGVLREALP